MPELVTAYVVCASREEAQTIGRALVEERLAACVNLRPHEAIYRWEGRIEQQTEWGLLAKTTRLAFARLTERVRALHSYACPCVVAWPVVDGLGPYLDWVSEQVAEAPAPAV